jgi:hypothetical protein
MQSAKSRRIKGFLVLAPYLFQTVVIPAPNASSWPRNVLLYQKLHRSDNEHLSKRYSLDLVVDNLYDLRCTQRASASSAVKAMIEDD